jgi:hypothetical protein
LKKFANFQRYTKNSKEIIYTDNLLRVIFNFNQKSEKSHIKLLILSKEEFWREYPKKDAKKEILKQKKYFEKILYI